MIYFPFLFIFFCKLIDAHIPSDQETREIERIQTEINQIKSIETISNPNSSDKDKSEAFEALKKDMG